MSAASPGASRFSVAASQTPWPFAAYMKSSAPEVPSSRLNPDSMLAMIASSLGSAWSIGWRCIAFSTSTGTCVGPGECSRRSPGICVGKVSLSFIRFGAVYTERLRAKYIRSD
jgi:hypothetical protein